MCTYECECGFSTYFQDACQEKRKNTLCLIVQVRCPGRINKYIRSNKIHFLPERNEIIQGIGELFLSFRRYFLQFLPITQIHCVIYIPGALGLEILGDFT